MFLKNFFHYFFGDFEKGSEEFKNQLIIRFVIIWLFLIFLSFLIFIVTKNISALLLWIAIFAIYSRYSDFHEEVKSNLQIIISSNKIVYLIYVLAYVMIIILIILSFAIFFFKIEF